MKIIIGVLLYGLTTLSIKGQRFDPDKAAIAYQQNKQWLQAVAPLEKPQQLDSIRSQLRRDYRNQDHLNRCSPIFVVDGYLFEVPPEADSAKLHTLLSCLTPQSVKEVKVLDQAAVHNVTSCKSFTWVVLITFSESQLIEDLKNRFITK